MSQDKIIVDEEVKRIALQMNEQMGVYFPADIKNETELEQYDELFRYLRELYFIYNDIDRDEVSQLFIQFYNSDTNTKEGYINTLANRIVRIIDLNAMKNEVDPSIEYDLIAETYLEQPDEVSKAGFLYFIAHGYVPEEGENIQEYIEMVKQINRNLYNYAHALEVEQQGNDVLVEPAEYDTATDPADVVARYLKGSGIYDPSQRNTGFRVDQDIENK